MAKGALRQGSPFAGMLEPFALCECVLYIKKTRELQTMSHCALLEYFGRVREDGLLISAAQAALEVVRKTVHEGESVPKVFELLKAYLRRLDKSAGLSMGAVEKLIWRFLLHYLKVMGFAPVFHACVRCGDEAFPQKVMVSPLSGGVLCGKCGLGTGDGRFVPAGVLRELDALFRLRHEELDGVTLKHRELLNELLFGFLRAHFEQDMKLNSLEVFYKL
jgi:DNA repair protein RecO